MTPLTARRRARGGSPGPCEGRSRTARDSPAIVEYRASVREAVVDLWEKHRAGAVVAVTTSGLVGRDGRARLGRGCARQAGERFPWLAARLGAAIAAAGNHVVALGERLVAFPVEHTPFEPPDLALVRRSAEELAALADAAGWTEVVLPRPGCGGGGLEWGEVRPVIAPLLDDRFLVITRPPGP